MTLRAVLLFDAQSVKWSENININQYHNTSCTKHGTSHKSIQQSFKSRATFYQAARIWISENILVIPGNWASFMFRQCLISINLVHLKGHHKASSSCSSGVSWHVAMHDQCHRLHRNIWKPHTNTINVLMEETLPVHNSVRYISLIRFVYRDDSWVYVSLNMYWCEVCKSYQQGLVMYRHWYMIIDVVR